MNERISLYSASLYSVACEENCAKDVYDGLKLAESVIKENAEYIKIMTSANLDSEIREKLVEEAFSDNVHIFCVNFMKMLAKKRIFDIIIPCIEEYEKQYFIDNNITRATITTAFELDDEKKKSVVEKISKSTGKSIIAEFVVRKDIVGGIIIETENSGIDASVEGKLQSIKRYISKI